MGVDPETRYRALFETTLDGIMVVDDAGYYVDVNDSMCRLLNAPRERLIGAHFSEFIPPDRLESASTDFTELKAMGSFEGEFPLRALDGSIVELEWRSRANFVPGLHFCVARDISTRKEAERELQRKQQELTDFLENAAVGLHWVGPDGTILWANRAELELLGYSPEEYIGHRITEFHADPSVIEEILRRLAAREELHNHEARLRCKDGSLRHVLISSNVMWEGERFVHARCFTRDITERKQAEEALKLHARVLESMTEGVSVADENGVIIYTNPAEDRMFGYERGELVGRHVTVQNDYPPEENARIVGEVIEQLRSQGTWTGEWRNRKQDGTLFTTSARITALPMGDRQYFVGVQEDITGRKRAERQVAAEHTITRILMESRTLQEAAPRILESLCQCIDGAAGDLWEVDPVQEALRCTAAWTRAGSPQLDQFQAVCRTMTFAPSTGLPGRVWRERKTTAIRELSRDRNFPRLTPAQAAGLRSGVAFPLVAGDECFGVLELFTQHVYEPDSAFVQMMTAVGQEIGQFVRRRRAEEALAAERERLRVTLASIGDAVIVTDAEGRPTFMNGVAEALTGWTEREARGKPLAEVFRIVNEQTRQVVESPVRRVLREGGVVGLANHTLLIARDGSERAIDDSAAPIPDGEGKMVGVVLVFRDVTERRRAEEVRSRLAAIVESSDLAIISKDMNGVVTSWNRAAERLYGYSAPEMVGQPILRIIPPGRANEFPELMERLRRGERIESYETVRVHKDGRLLDVVVTISPIYNHSRQVAGASAIARDVTAAKRAEKEQQESDQRLRLALQAGRMGTWEWDTRTGQVTWSADLEAIHGLAPGTFGRTFDAYLSSVHPDDRERVTAALHRTLEEGAGHLIEYRLLWADGTVRWVEGRGRIFRDDSGQPHRMIGVCMDITERKLTEEALQEAARRKDEFLAMLAHELRNPLAPIRNALHLMRLKPGDASVAVRWQQMLDRQVTHLTRLVDDLLDVSRINRGKISLQHHRVELKELVRLTVEDQRPAFEEAGLTVAMRLPETLVWTVGDATRLTQVLDNLLENARKFTDRGGRVTVELEVDAPLQQAVIMVRDTGIGIESEILPRLFDVFAQADRSLERSRGGLGLGLALVKGLAELHGGSVEADSAGVGEGATFIVRLPLQPVPEAGLERPASDGPLSVGGEILIIEDNRDAAATLRDLLELHGCQVTVAHTGPEGLELARQKRPRVIICDIGLPGMDGYAVASALRREEELSHTRLIAMSGYGQEADMRRSSRAGFDGHLVKPVDPEKLFHHLQETGIHRDTPGG